VVVVVGLVVMCFATPEDSWICQGDLWVKHGNPSSSIPTIPCAYGNSENGQVQNISTGLANPASTNCVDKGGTLQIEDGPNGQFGVCYFEDNRQCEEWAFYRGDCPVGGRKVTGYINQAARYCAITGGEYTITVQGNETTEKGTCTLPNGAICDADDYYNGSCPWVE